MHVDTKQLKGLIMTNVRNSKFYSHFLDAFYQLRKADLDAQAKGLGGRFIYASDGGDVMLPLNKTDKAMNETMKTLLELGFGKPVDRLVFKDSGFNSDSTVTVVILDNGHYIIALQGAFIY